MLIDAGADLNIQDTAGLTALHRCARWNHPEIARMLIDAGADLNIQDTDGWTALYWCAFSNHLGILGLLIDAGADKTIPTNDGKLPYELADYQELQELLYI
jgi:ankyrin repeat protein